MFSKIKKFLMSPDSWGNMLIWYKEQFKKVNYGRADSRFILLIVIAFFFMIWLYWVARIFGMAIAVIYNYAVFPLIFQIVKGQVVTANTVGNLLFCVAMVKVIFLVLFSSQKQESQEIDRGNEESINKLEELNYQIAELKISLSCVSAIGTTTASLMQLASLPHKIILEFLTNNTESQKEQIRFIFWVAFSKKAKIILEDSGFGLRGSESSKIAVKLDRAIVTHDFTVTRKKGQSSLTDINRTEISEAIAQLSDKVLNKIIEIKALNPEQN